MKDAEEPVRRGRRLIMDVALWLGLCGWVVIDAGSSTRHWELLAGLTATTAAIALSRRYPLVSLGIAMVASFVVMGSFGGRVPIWEGFVLVAVSYLAGYRQPVAKPMLRLFTVVSLVAVPVALVWSRDGFASWGALLGVLVFASVTPWLMGRYVRQREDMARDGWRRAEEMESRQRLVADRARLRERTRIASDMHDSLGHELSLIAVRAAALEVAGGLDEPQRQAAGELRQSAATATERLREIIGVLREDDAPTEPVDESIDDLLDRARASGVLIVSSVDGPVDGEPRMVDRAAYRVVQESVTNVVKHAPGAAVTVRVARSAGRTDVVVTNAAPPAGPLPGRTSGKRGLIGLRERVRLVGGTLRAGPHDGGFEVGATLPHDAAPSEETPESQAAMDAEVGQSVSARELERARRDVRRSLIQAIVVPIGLFGVVVAISGSVFLVQWYRSVLPGGDYDRIRLGQTRAELASVLPAGQRIARPRVVEPTAPAGATCEYYGTERTVFNLNYEAYRLCFADGKLVAKDMITEDEQRGNPDDPGGAGR
ncbi:two component sensor kinase [Amycolatopsis azurea DSM 43854]|uniref:histidine kinase n=1 Tax=Amycolatopsis azurea DSM 43854 TaxID=1238180 RepID=M2Q6J1_9PSEU|nr:two component sensor kinase [Amycolatopsis azurea DSM 43854]